ncbi:MAG TPA: thioredoxin domain-containing protein [Terriglobales bacterium]|jgi:protein-disulfide isomerase|nr:thioredoxin domain-containing protein [Terriglobales bacterium]
MKKLIAIATCIFLLLSLASAQSSSTAKDPAAKDPASAKAADTGFPLPSTEEVDVAMKRTFGYDPSLTWQILAIRPSAIAGVADVIVSINKQSATHIYLPPDEQNAIVGEIVPFGSNPFAPARAKLQAADGPARGPQAAAISVVEFSDLECPHCKAAQPVADKLAADFPQVRFIFQQFPLPASMHPWAMKAAEYSDCAAHTNGNDAFWKYTDAIFDKQESIDVATADDKLKEIATAAGMDAQKVAACASSPETEARIRKSMALAQSLDVNQTPTVFINGRSVLGIASIPYDQLKNLVQFEIDHAGR